MRVPVVNLVGPEGSGFLQIMQQVQVERAFIAVQCYATAQRCLDLTQNWVKKRETFGRPLSTRQVVRHKIVDMSTAVDVARTYTRAAVDRIVAGDTDVRMVSMAKNQAVEACALAVDTAPSNYTVAWATYARPRSKGTIAIRASWVSGAAPPKS